MIFATVAQMSRYPVVSHFCVTGILRHAAVLYGSGWSKSRG
jgi:hypothetical protein